MQVCVNIQPNCDVCKEVLGDVCFTSLNIHTELSSSTSVYVWIRDKFGNLYRNAQMTNYDSSIDIESNSYPEGLFIIPQAFDLFVSSDIQGSVIVPLLLNPNVNCIKLNIQ